jgi:hypothetical protein
MHILKTPTWRWIDPGIPITYSAGEAADTLPLTQVNVRFGRKNGNTNPARDSPQTTKVAAKPSWIK